MDRWRAIAKAVVVNEIVNFRLDMQEHMLLTDGRDCGDDDEEGYYEEMGGDAPAATDSARATNASADGKSRSVIFGLLVKPFVKGRKKIRKLGRKKKTNTSNPATQDAGSAYTPPATAGTGMV